MKTSINDRNSCARVASPALIWSPPPSGCDRSRRKLRFYFISSRDFIDWHSNISDEMCPILIDDWWRRWPVLVVDIYLGCLTRSSTYWHISSSVYWSISIWTSLVALIMATSWGEGKHLALHLKEKKKLDEPISGFCHLNRLWRKLRCATCRLGRRSWRPFTTSRHLLIFPTRAFGGLRY